MSKQGETLEQRANEFLRSDEWVDSLGHRGEVSALTAFAHKLLEEARPYMQHQPSCLADMGKPCSCGLAELLEGWK